MSTPQFTPPPPMKYSVSLYGAGGESSVVMGADGKPALFTEEELANMRFICGDGSDTPAIVDQTDLGASDDRPLGPDHPVYQAH